ncbi:MAG: hypothetical protein WCT03_06760 [Candidatus Obscuribacterales bacterium]|jgi:hypothetical protein
MMNLDPIVLNGSIVDEVLALIYGIRLECQLLSMVIAPTIQSKQSLDEWTRQIGRLEIYTTRAIVNILENNTFEGAPDLGEECTILSKLVEQFGSYTSLLEVTPHFFEKPSDRLCANTSSARLVITVIDVIENQIIALFNCMKLETIPLKKRRFADWMGILRNDVNHLKIRLYLDFPEIIESENWQKIVDGVVEQWKDAN